MIRGICNTRHATTFDWLGRRGGGATCRHAWNAAVRGVAAVTQGPLSPGRGKRHPGVEEEADASVGARADDAQQHGGAVDDPRPRIAAWPGCYPGSRPDGRAG